MILISLFFIYGLLGCTNGLNAASITSTSSQSSDSFYPADSPEAEQIETMQAAPLPSEAEIASAWATGEAVVAQATLIPKATPMLGIFDSGILVEGLPPRWVTVANVWHGYFDENLALVYAGKLYPDYRANPNPVITDHGAVFISMNKGGEVIWQLIQTEDEVGSLRIIEAKDGYLLLTAAISGQTFRFDLDTLKLDVVE